MDEGSFDIRQAHKLDSPGRIRDLRPTELLNKVAKLAEGDTCIDFGSGTGIFAFAMAALVGLRGKVYAVDNSGEMLARVKAKNPPINLVLVNADVGRTGLYSRIADVCLLALIMHELPEPDVVVKEASRLLKSGGRLIVVEWKAELDSPGPPQKRRISRERMEQLFRDNGFTMESYLDWSQYHYVTAGNYFGSNE